MFNGFARVTGFVYANYGPLRQGPLDATVVFTPVQLDETQDIVDDRTPVVAPVNTTGELATAVYLWPGVWRIKLPDTDETFKAHVEANTAYELVTLRGAELPPETTYNVIPVKGTVPDGWLLIKDGTEAAGLDPEVFAGSIGPEGPPGPVGPVGPKGDRGDRGLTGPTGPQGLVGETGPKGARGEKGDRGERGYTGANGPMGPRGPQGDKGDRGEIGPIGPKGEVGPIGPAGPEGPVGPQGERGIQGATGPQGQAGPKGDTGDVGPQGPVGETGAQGPKGDKGDVGPMGPEGPQGIQGDAGDPYAIANIVTLTASTTLDSSHFGKFIIVDSETAVTLTMPAPSLGQRLDVIAKGTGMITFVGDVVGTPSLVTRAQYSGVTLISDATTWYAIGDFA